MTSKAQSALELLMSYGWAVLVVLLVLGTLAYFGVLKPGNLLGDRCRLPAGKSCDDFSITGNVVKVVITNGLDRQENVTSFAARSSDGAACASGGGVILPPSGRVTINATCVGLAPAGERQHLLLNITYQTVGGLDHAVQGDLYATVG